MEPHFYTVDINWNESRKGVLCSPDFNKEGGACIEVATPPEFSKGIAGIWSPEHLFTAAVSSCLMTTFLAIAENSNLAFTHFECRSKGKLDVVDGKYMMSEIILEPIVTISDGTQEEKALRIIQKAEAACLISNSMKSKVTMIPTIRVDA